MKIGDSIKLQKETGKIVTGIITKIFDKKHLTIKVKNSNGTTQSYHRITELPTGNKEIKPLTAYWIKTEQLKAVDTKKLKQF